MKYGTVKDILYDVFIEDEIKIEGYNEFSGVTERIHDNRPYPKGMSQHDFNRFMHSDPEKLPFSPPEEKRKKFKELVKNFKAIHAHCDIYEDTNEVEHCAIRALY